jgi:hypothetical protein
MVAPSFFTLCVLLRAAAARPAAAAAPERSRLHSPQRAQGNEGPLENYADHTGAMWEHAESAGALLVFAE